jgi:YD repeat-containing protein
VVEPRHAAETARQGGRGQPGATLRYRGGGTGHPDHPKPPSWNATLGRFWSHDYAEAIVEDPDDGEGNVTGYVYSDRDLMTRETSEVSGITEYVYNEHGELTSQTDARGITMERTVDELDRVTFVDYPTDSLDTTYVYDDPLVPFSLGRLTSIVRGGTSVDYEYDRFGRRVWFPY